MSSQFPTRAFLLSTALASVLSLGASVPAMAAVTDVFAFGQTGQGQTYASYGQLELGTGSGPAIPNISTNGNQGWVTDALNSGQSHTAGANGSTTYTAGSCGTASGCLLAQNHNNYFVFSLAGIKGPVTTATLALAAGNVVGSGYYNIYDATPLAGQLLNGPASPSGLFSQLTTQGALIGNIQFTASDTGGTFDITLNALGLRDLNYDIAHHYANFAIGGAVTTPDPASPSDPFPPPSAPSPLPGVGLLQSLGLLGLLAFAAARARSRT